MPLPIPRDVSPTPATVVVLPDDNVELVPSPEEIVGLTPQRIASLAELPARQQAPLFYRGDAEQPRFSGQIR